jgi:hypothetical protein
METELLAFKVNDEDVEALVSFMKEFERTNG